MNTNKLKAYAPKARVAFMEAVKSRAAKLGIFEDRISEITIDGDSAIIEKEVYTRKQGLQRNQLVKRIEALGTHDGKFVHKDGFNQFINETAFTWFNRLTAIRYMEVNEYLDHGFRVLSKAEGAKFGEGFEILNSAADVADELGLNKDQIIDMVLDGNKEEELYRTLLLAQCHQLSEAMPFMFEKLDDATELLLPDNLTKTDSILKDLVNDIPEDNWQEIEVIGWLYQFYISEHKDAVMGKVVKCEDIPAATQLFTPNWIVKYLVQNSLGRQWLATYPDSELKEKMEYYITPTEQSDDVIEQLKAITPTSIDPEDIKVLDPACGSGHILVEVYEVLREIYLERGYRLREIPELILTKNIYGLDIDDRAAQMAAFAVLMKAREDDKRIFTRDIKLNIHSIQSTENLNINQLWADIDLDGNKQPGSMGDLFAEPQQKLEEPSAENKAYLELLRYLKVQFKDGKYLGSLIKVAPKYSICLAKFKSLLEVKEHSSNSTTRSAVEILLPIVQQALVLSHLYNVCVANPPYMGSRNMPKRLKTLTQKHFPSSKHDMYAMFLERVFSSLKLGGYNSQIQMHSWMFLGVYEKLRQDILTNYTISSIAHLGSRAFDEISGEVVQTSATCIQNLKSKGFKAAYQRLVDGNSTSKRDNLFNAQFQYRNVTQEQFYSIPGSPIAYWVPEKVRSLFENNSNFGECSESRKGMVTANNDKYVRDWCELSVNKISLNSDNRENAKASLCKWFPYLKGGDFRRWYGNLESVVNWENDGYELQTTKHPTENRIHATNFNLDYIFKPGLTWSDITTNNLGFRFTHSGFIFDAKSPTAFGFQNPYFALGLLNSNLSAYLAKIINPTVSFQVGNYNSLLALSSTKELEIAKIVKDIVSLSKLDWDSMERSWDFRTSPLLLNNNLIKKAYIDYFEKCEAVSIDLNAKENQINDILNSEFDLSDVVSSTVTIENTTLKSNIWNRYAADKKATNEFKINRFQSETLTEFLSFSVGCMMGRYSLDREGLVYAHSDNNGFKEFVAEGAFKTFPADDDGIVPLADEDWVFEDDATTRFREFVKTVWGEENLQENLDFIAESLCLDAIKAKKGESSIDTIRRYFSTQFYKDHLKTYKKRPIYWLFSSGKAKAFECLVYLHRYNEGTLSRMRTEYVTPLMGKLESRKNILEDSKATASGAELRAIDKELKTIEKKQAELFTFDEELKHLAEMKISLDLDDGVKVNYGKFGNLLADVKAIHGKKPEVIK
ncbi:BREX-1 system adenine-specific DNA-methyltransferase PglX [Vibrio vulnificus]|uniref:BREX-1 system adenine-specific DNA-methyltransferase PglX n=1 Tax=Vibrio vulnificus TaxID=672 RepID=UPI001CDBBCDC|nr:BREX-1 system adenine-specific DNA-methyltransferase PglX [Vibrio vulnificus]MCA3964458.1 BREX-1 system adenine-specific DNA-methyltransferase PglX [Vibrio vulnificus]